MESIQKIVQTIIQHPQYICVLIVSIFTSTLIQCAITYHPKLQKLRKQYLKNKNDHENAQKLEAAFQQMMKLPQNKNIFTEWLFNYIVVKLSLKVSGALSSQLIKQFAVVIPKFGPIEQLPIIPVRFHPFLTLLVIQQLLAIPIRMFITVFLPPFKASPKLVKVGQFLLSYMLNQLNEIKNLNKQTEDIIQQQKQKKAAEKQEITDKKHE